MKKLLILALSAAAFASPAHALVVVTGSGTLDTTDPTTAERLFRDGIPSTWAAPKAFPGTIGGGPYVYDLVSPGFAPNATQDVYYRISFSNNNSLGTPQPHSTAYNGSFNPADFSENYLGDSGSSPLDGETLFYEVIVGAGGSLVVHFGETFQGALPSEYSYTIEAFSDANGGENFGIVPEPATWAMMLAGVGIAGGALRRRRAQNTTVRFA